MNRENFFRGYEMKSGKMGAIVSFKYNDDHYNNFEENNFPILHFGMFFSVFICGHFYDDCC